MQNEPSESESNAKSRVGCPFESRSYYPTPLGPRLSNLFLIDDHRNGCTRPWSGSNRAAIVTSRMDRTRR